MYAALVWYHSIKSKGIKTKIRRLNRLGMNTYAIVHRSRMRDGDYFRYFSTRIVSTERSSLLISSTKTFLNLRLARISQSNLEVYFTFIVITKGN